MFPEARRSRDSPLGCLCGAEPRSNSNGLRCEDATPDLIDVPFETGILFIFFGCLVCFTINYICFVSSNYTLFRKF
jgi:hypothetical protein